MSTAPQLHPEEHDQTDDFSALEQRVMRMVELFRLERRERQKAEETASTLQQLLDEQGSQLQRAQEELHSLSQERDQVRGRVERLLKATQEKNEFAQCTEWRRICNRLHLRPNLPLAWSRPRRHRAASHPGRRQDACRGFAWHNRGFAPRRCPCGSQYRG